MADSRIKGITVEIGGDTTDLSASLKEINAESKKTSTELSDVNRLLKFNPQNTELLAQRQQLLNQQIQTTSTRLEHLRSVEGQVQRQFERGDIGEQQFRAFQRELIATEGRLRHFETQAAGTSRNVRGAFASLGEGLKGAIGAAVAGEGLKEVISQSLEAAHLQTQIKVGFDLPPEAQAQVQGLVNGIKAYGVEGEAALEGVRRQFAMNSDKSTEYNTQIAKQAAVISQAYAGIDYTELIQETNEMSGSLEMSQQDALGMVNSLLKMGFPPDQLDIITEYGAQLHRAGYNASEIQGIFKAGIDTKSWNIDKLMDGIKEGRIRLAQFGQGVDKTTAGLIKGTDISTQKLKDWGNQLTQGGDAGKIAMGEVANALAGVKDENKRNAIGVQLFGTMWEDTGKKITDTMLNYKKNAGDAKKNQDDLNASQKAMDADPQVKLNKALQDMNTALLPLLTTVAQWVGQLASWVSQNPQLAAGIAAVVVGVGILIGLIAAAAAVIAVLDAAALALNMTMLPLIAIILGIMIVIGLLIAIGYELYKNWDHIKAKASELVANIKVQWEAFKAATETKFNAAKEKIKSIWDSIMTFFRNIDLKKIGHDIIQGLINGIGSMAQKAWDKAKEIATGIGKAISKAVGRSSPAKMTIAIGQDIGKGLQIGLDQTHDRINQASNRMAAASIPEPPQPSIQNQTVGGKSMTVNITSPKALDVREANRAFNQSMQRIALLW